MALTTHQQGVLEEIILLLKQGHYRIVLKGSAGTGKTFLSAELIKVLKSIDIIPRRNGLIFATAPTNKALAVLQGKIETGAEFKTIHSACKLFQYIDSKTGAATFIRNRGGGRNRDKQDDFEHCRAAVIDESSMLNSDFLKEHKVTIRGDTYTERGYLEDFRFPIIFIGDEKQLNPVGEEVSPIWKAGYPEVELKEIIRQGEGNPIIDLSRDLDMMFFRRPMLTSSGKGYMFSNNNQNFVERLAEVNGTDDLKYLAYTNKIVDAMNSSVRKHRYGNPKRIEEGETVVFNSPFGSFYTNQEVLVEKAEVVTDYVQIPTHDTGYDDKNLPTGKMDMIRLKFYMVNEKFRVVHEHSDILYKAIYASLKDNNRVYGWDGRGFHYFANCFADIKYNHAITIHKSQGSTYKESIINIGNVMINRNVKEREKMLYTAVTRSSDLVTLNNV
jgi:hypothetical protein